MLLQISIAAVTSLMSVIIMYQNGNWTAGKPVPEWLLAVTRLSRNIHIGRSREARSFARSSKKVRLRVLF